VSSNSHRQLDAESLDPVVAIILSGRELENLDDHMAGLARHAAFPMDNQVWAARVGETDHSDKRRDLFPPFRPFTFSLTRPVIGVAFPRTVQFRWQPVCCWESILQAKRVSYLLSE
jgi:hypothetical protein